jgi:hypothetical protein
MGTHFEFVLVGDGCRYVGVLMEAKQKRAVPKGSEASRAMEQRIDPAMDKPRRSPPSDGVAAAESAEDQEVVRRGEEIYQHAIRSKVEEGNRGAFLVLDVNTGEYEMDSNHLSAAERLQCRLPDAVLYTVRVGYPAAYQGSRRFANPA